SDRRSASAFVRLLIQPGSAPADAAALMFDLLGGFLVEGLLVAQCGRRNRLNADGLVELVEAWPRSLVGNVLLLLSTHGTCPCVCTGVCCDGSHRVGRLALSMSVIASEKLEHDRSGAPCCGVRLDALAGRCLLVVVPLCPLICRQMRQIAHHMCNLGLFNNDA